MSHLQNLCAARLAAALLLALLAGCASRNDPRGNPVPALDWAAIEGVRLHSLFLADGSTATLRFHDGLYSLKLQRSGTVVPLHGATRVRLQETRQVHGKTLVLLDTGTRACHHKTVVLAIKDPAVKMWDLGNCLTQPTVRMVGQRVLIEFQESTPVMRFDYQGDTLRRQQDFGRWQPHQSVRPAPLLSAL